MAEYQEPEVMDGEYETGIHEMESRELTEDESRRLIQLEKIISKNLSAFVETGYALAEIRNRRLHRNTHKTFEAYCKTKIGIGRVYAHRLICAYEVNQNLLPIGNILPSTESQARPLIPLQPVEQQAVWQHIVKSAEVEGKRITTGFVKSIVKKYLNNEVTVKVEKLKRTVQTEPEISPDLRLAFATMMDRLQAEKLSGWKNTSRSMVLTALNQLTAIILDVKEAA